MDFFEQQDRTRRKTKTLVVLFSLAVVLISASVYAAVQVFLWVHGLQALTRVSANGIPFEFAWWNPKIFWITTASTLSVIALGSLWRIYSLSQGGCSVALMLGGSPLGFDRSTNDEQRFRNVVEEMSIASGVPVPEMFILKNEKGINAFAAGYSSGDAALAVTQGCLDKLSRDELQGVVGHEFSHILHGDMRLNLRLAGLLFGILLIGLTGRILMRSRGRKSGGLVLVGLILAIIGHVGVFFGRLIQSAVSRQREFLADASSVQFTRNPSGLLGALRKIGGLDTGSRLEAREAAGFNHMMFGSALTSRGFRWLASHPPLEERIRALDPSFREEVSERPRRDLPVDALAVSSLSGTTLIDKAGTFDSEHVAYASALLKKLPDPILRALNDTELSQALVFAVLLSSLEDPSQALTYLEKTRGTRTETESLLTSVRAAGRNARLPLVDLALPALRRLSAERIEQFNRVLSELMKLDGTVSLFEFVLIRTVVRHLRDHKKPRRRSPVRFRSADPLQGDLQVLFSALASAGAKNPIQTEAAYRKGMSRMFREPPPPLPTARCGVTELHRALGRLSEAAPLLKREILQAGLATVQADQRIETEEAELLRAIADTLECPLPPLVQEAA